MPIATEEEPEDSDEDAPCRVRPLRSSILSLADVMPLSPHFASSTVLQRHFLLPKYSRRSASSSSDISQVPTLPVAALLS